MKTSEKNWYDAYEVKPTTEVKAKKKFKITADHINVAGIIIGIIATILFIAFS